MSSAFNWPVTEGNNGRVRHLDLPGQEEDKPRHRIGYLCQVDGERKNKRRLSPVNIEYIHFALAAVFLDLPLVICINYRTVEYDNMSAGCWM